jgi:hypothetical protein
MGKPRGMLVLTFHGKDLVSSHSVHAAQRRMTTASSITTSKSNSDSLSSDDSNAIGLGKLIGLPDLDTSANLDSRANVAVGRLVLGVELGVLQPVGPDGQSTLARSLAVEVMAGVLHHEAEVEVTGKVDSELDLGNI